VADIDFKISGGPYAGTYGVDLKDITASDVGDLISAGGPDLDAIFSGGGRPGTRVMAGLVWIVRRRGNRGLAFRAVSDHISMDVIQPVEEPASGDATASALPDPTSSAAG
jgi:hypothetical protein